MAKIYKEEAAENFLSLQLREKGNFLSSERNKMVMADCAGTVKKYKTPAIR